jgi:hypothetical protein
VDVFLNGNDLEGPVPDLGACPSLRRFYSAGNARLTGPVPAVDTRALHAGLLHGREAGAAPGAAGAAGGAGLKGGWRYHPAYVSPGAPDSWYADRSSGLADADGPLAEELLADGLLADGEPAVAVDIGMVGQPGARVA